MKKRLYSGAAVGTMLCLLAGLLAALDAGAASTGASPVAGARCGPVQNPDGDLLVTSDLPLHGAEAGQAQQMSAAIALVLEKTSWKAGGYTIAYQSCDDSTSKAGHWDSTTCESNAKAYGADPSVVAVIGPVNSGCAEVELPDENRAARGPLAMVSPATTYVGLTHSGPGAAAGEPGTYYPTGARSFARVIAANDVQAAADATLAARLKIGKLFVLNDKEAYGAGIAADMAFAAKKLGIAIVKNAAWDPSASTYDALAAQIKASGAQAVFFGGLVSGNTGRLIEAVRTAAPTVTLIAPDGFTPVAADVVQSAGKANGMYVSVAGVPSAQLPPPGQAFLKAFAAGNGGSAIDPYLVYAAQAATVALKAIAASDGTRSGVSSQLLKVQIRHSLVGPVSFDGDGDIVSGAVTIYKIDGGKPTVAAVIVPKSSLLPTP